MTTEAQYAKALFDLMLESPQKSAEYLQGLKATLARQGHQKLLPRIFAEYCTLIEHKERSARYSAPTPQAARTRKLLELYRTLVSSN